MTYAALGNLSAVLRLGFAGWGLFFLGNLPWYFLSAGLADVIVIVIVLASHPSFRAGRPSATLARKGLTVLPGNLASQAYTNLDVILISAILGSAAAGIYGALYKLQYVGLALYTVVAQFLTPRPDLYGYGRPARQTRHLLWAGAMLWPMVVATVLITARSILPSVYASNVDLLMILSLQMTIALVTLPSTLLVLKDWPAAYSWMSLAGLASNACLLLLLLRSFHLAGAAWATVSAELCVTAVALIFASRLRGRTSREFIR